jgi:hypothetical protein
MKRKKFSVKATKYDAAMQKAKVKCGADYVVGDLRLKKLGDIGKKGMRPWQVIAHKRMRK